VLTRCVRLVFHSTPVVLVATFTLLLLIALRSGWTGVPLLALVVSWFFKYCFVVLDTALAGRNELPVLSVEMLNPFDEQRPLTFGLLVVACTSLVFAAKAYVGGVIALLLATLLGVLLPASIAVLGLSSNVLLAAWPPRLLETLRAMGWDYVLLNLALLIAGVILYGQLSLAVPTWLALIALQLLFFMLFGLIGSAIFEHRLEFGLDTRTPEEHREERDRREHNQARQRAIDHAYEQFRVQKPLEGWREIETWLKAHAVGDATLREYHAVFEAACGWDDVRPGDRLANELIGLLLARRQTGVALEVAERRFAVNPQFRPTSAQRLTELAAVAGKRALRRQLEAKP
jgi:hypothetical protein